MTTRPDFNKFPTSRSPRIKYPCGVEPCRHEMEIQAHQYPYPGQPPRSPETARLSMVQMGEWLKLEVIEQTYRWHLENDHDFTDQVAIGKEIQRYTERKRQDLLKRINDAEERGQRDEENDVKDDEKD